MGLQHEHQLPYVVETAIQLYRHNPCFIQLPVLVDCLRQLSVMEY